MVVAASIGATSHADDPTRLGHLVVYLAQSRCHLVGERAGYNHHISLSRRGSEDDPKSILVISGSSNVHHFYCTTRQSKRHRPNRSLSCPVNNLINCTHDIFSPVSWGVKAERIASLYRQSESRRISRGVGLLGRFDNSSCTDGSRRCQIVILLDKGCGFGIHRGHHGPRFPAYSVPQEAGLDRAVEILLLMIDPDSQRTGQTGKAGGGRHVGLASRYSVGDVFL